MSFLRRRQGGRRQDTDDRWRSFSVPSEVFTGGFPDEFTHTRFNEYERIPATSVASLPTPLTAQSEDSPPSTPIDGPTPTTAPATIPARPTTVRPTLRVVTTTNEEDALETADTDNELVTAEPTSPAAATPTPQTSRSPTTPPPPPPTTNPSRSTQFDAEQLVSTSSPEPTGAFTSQPAALVPQPTTLVTTTPSTLPASLPSNTLIDTSASSSPIPTALVGPNIPGDGPPAFGSQSGTIPPHPSRPNTLAAALPPIIVILLLGGLLALYLRRRHRRRRQHQQLSTHPLSEKLVPAYTYPLADSGASTPVIGTAVAVPYFHAHARATTPRFSAPTPAVHVQSPSLASLHPTPPAPVIIAPLSRSNAAYYSGIDTSDAVSVTPSGRAISAYNRCSSEAGHEEPPPPYRPRSVPSISESRNSSLRLPEGLRAMLVMERGRQGQEREHERGRTAEAGDRRGERNPFEDPDADEGGVSDAEDGGVVDGMGSRDMEEMSEVSELSYQSEGEEAVPRMGV
ncbi:hypothetical protein W97_01367 [Coniosporium apollinis CBS 100218]|uniref:Uncharacterized protein n=1 Tax=Coniosporium apollinis (strain CBS 100218) TaxID=1168221 RepID=R7YJV2_CONA1|nr:uncharacterized protein W97_01367 [Coniosporium apollinis CBS 100218]EON62148.1 hypothetical protein W97_01367 [Coniosporium apollinis CBS 100218]